MICSLFDIRRIYMEIIVGGIVEKDGKILMVQEKKKRC